jgi:predicted SprT family Zn-dependent metalloprotease
MYVVMQHQTETYLKENFITFTPETFIEQVRTIAEEVGINDLPEIHFYKESEGELGVCVSEKIRGKVQIVALAFHEDLRNGENFSIHQINEAIKHELAHMIANLRHNELCGHDERFMTVVREIGGEPSQTLSLTKVSLGFSLEKLSQTEHIANFTLTCSNCDKIHYQTNDYKVFELFVMSGADTPLLPYITWRELKAKSACCSSNYKLEARAESLLDGLEKENQVEALQTRLKEMLASSSS